MEPTTSRRTWLWTLLIASLAFNIGFGATFAVRTVRKAGDAVPAPAPSLADRLDLTPAQRKRLAEERRRLTERVDALQGEMAEAQAKLADMLVEAEPDRDAVAAQLGTMTTLQRRMQECVIDHLLEERRRIPPGARKVFDDAVREQVCPGCRRDGGGRGAREGRGSGGGRGEGRGGGGRGRGGCGRHAR
jgi:Spy/CpxP family protein refolding chaperone